jgi:cell division septation protein DedD
MRSTVISIILCVVVDAAAAQCVAQPPVAIAPVTVAAVAKSPHPGGELIQTAAAGTREVPPSFQPAPRATSEGESHPRRTGSAMLLAALALMSGIALRRLNSGKQ